MGILQARILEWVARPSSKGFSQLRDQTQSPTLQVDSLLSESPGKPKNTGMGSLSILQGIFPMQESNRGVSNEKACTSSGRKYEQESKPTRFSQVSGSATNEY